jgi:hypothetical protein
MPITQIAQTTLRRASLEEARVEAHQHVRQAGGPEHQRHRQRDEVDLGELLSAVLTPG